MHKIAVLCASVVLGFAQSGGPSVSLGRPPVATAPALEVSTAPKSRLQPKTSSAFLDLSDRNAVSTAYSKLLTMKSPVGWHGNVAQCDAGSTAYEYRVVVRDRVNWFRSMAGVPGITFNLVQYRDPSLQEAALMMSANQALSHYPPTSWKCFSFGGAIAAGDSNLCLGFDLTMDPGCVQGYIEDPGSNNEEVGHRRWLLYPETQTMGTGDVTGSIVHSRVAR